MSSTQHIWHKQTPPNQSPNPATNINVLPTLHRADYKVSFELGPARSESRTAVVSYLISSQEMHCTVYLHRLYMVRYK